MNSIMLESSVTGVAPVSPVDDTHHAAVITIIGVATIQPPWQAIYRRTVTRLQDGDEIAPGEEHIRSVTTRGRPWNSH